MRYQYLAILLVACGGNEPDPSPSVEGIWRVTAVNGQPMPAPTVSGETLLGGYLDLAVEPIGGVEYCVTTGGTPQSRFHEIRWRVDGERLIVSYRNLPGFSPIDTAIIDGETLHWHIKAAEALLGTSQWDLTRISTDGEAPNACP